MYKSRGWHWQWQSSLIDSVDFRLDATESFFHYNDEDDQSCDVPDQDKTWHTCSYDLDSNVQNKVDYEGYFLPSPSLPPLSGGNTYASPGKTIFVTMLNLNIIDYFYHLIK